MVIAQITTDNREAFREYHLEQPNFGPAPRALLQGFAREPSARVHVLSCTKQKLVSPEKIADNIWFHSLPVAKIGWMSTGYQGCARAVRRKLRELRPDIVHGQGTERECSVSAVLSGFPNVVTIHGNARRVARLYHARPFSFWWLAARLESFTLRRTCGIFCNSGYTEREVAPLAAKTWRVPNALRLPFLEDAPASPRREGVPLLLNIGVIGRMKRQLELLRLAAALHAEGHRFELQFVGSISSDPEAQVFLREVAAAEAAGFARHVGTLNTAGIMARMDSAHALVHVSAEEAFGLVVAEALARGMRIFGFAVGGVPDVVQGIPGARLMAENDWSSLGREIASWLRSGAAASPESPAAVRERYHPDVVVSRHLEIYREVLGAGAPDAAT